jgi:predicted nucleic acid-binding protein
MGVSDLERVLAGCRLILLDTMVFSYHLAGHPRYVSLTAAVLAAVEAGRVNGIITAVTLAEILTAPAKANNLRALQEYQLYLTQFPNLRLAPLDAALAVETALVRAETGLRTPDAVQVAAARVSGADAIITNDRRWAGRVARPALVMMEEYAEL